LNRKVYDLLLNNGSESEISELLEKGADNYEAIVLYSTSVKLVNRYINNRTITITSPYYRQYVSNLIEVLIKSPEIQTDIFNKMIYIASKEPDFKNHDLFIKLFEHKPEYIMLCHKKTDFFFMNKIKNVLLESKNVKVIKYFVEAKIITTEYLTRKGVLLD
jgi:hypothetical protein